MNQLTNEQRELLRLLSLLGVDAPDYFIANHPPERIRAAVYEMRLRRKGKAWLCGCLRHGWSCSEPPAWWDIHDTRPIAEQTEEHEARQREQRRAAAAYEQTRREQADVWQHTRRPTEEEARDLHALMEQLRDRMTPEEQAVLSRLREARLGKGEA